MDNNIDQDMELQDSIEIASPSNVHTVEQARLTDSPRCMFYIPDAHQQLSVTGPS